MTRLRVLFARLLGSFGLHRRDDELREEIDAHLDVLTTEHVDRGLPHAKARAAAKREFGGMDQTRERYRDGRGFPFLDSLTQDLRYAIRALGRFPGFTAVVVLTLSLGIGVSTAIFTLADALLWRPLAVENPERLIRIAAREAQGPSLGVLLPIVDRIREENVFEGVCGFMTPSVIVDINGRTTPTQTHLFTQNCFNTLGVKPILGRLLTAADSHHGAPAVVVLAHDTWTTEYGGSPSVLGATINVDGAHHTIVGVTQRGFTGLRVGTPARLFIPMENLGAGLAAYFPPREQLPVSVVARIASSASLDTTAALLEPQWQLWLKESAHSRMPPQQRDRYLQRRLEVTSASTGIDGGLRERFGTPLLALLAISGVVLLITCVNVANLFLARFTRQLRETTVRVALGASRGRLLQSATIESIAFVAAGAAAGMVLAYWTDAALVRFLSAVTPETGLDVAPNLRVFAFTTCASAIAVCLCAMAPAWKAARVNPASLPTGSTRIAGDVGRLGHAAVVSQVALTIVLVAAGALFVNMLQNFREASLGFSVERLLSVQLSPQPGGYPRGFASGPYYRALLGRIPGLVDVESSALAYHRPLTAAPWLVRAARSGSERDVEVQQAFVTEGFFSTTDIPLLAGETFGPSEPNSQDRTAIVSQSLATQLFGTAQAVGQRIRVGAAPINGAVRIVGVARDAVLWNPQQRNTAAVYLNFWQFRQDIQAYPTLLIKTREPAAFGTDVLRRIVRDAGREYVSLVRTGEDLRAAALLQERLLATVGSVFGILGLAIAGIGLYGSLSYSVTRRSSEIGLRLALGGTARHVMRIVLGHAAALTITGVAVGLPIAWATTVAISSRLPVPAAHAAVITIALAAALAIAAVAAWLPARRATRVDPAVALRHE